MAFAGKPFCGGNYLSEFVSDVSENGGNERYSGGRLGRAYGCIWCKSAGDSAEPSDTPE